MLCIWKLLGYGSKSKQMLNKVSLTFEIRNVPLFPTQKVFFFFFFFFFLSYTELHVLTVVVDKTN